MSELMNSSLHNWTSRWLVDGKLGVALEEVEIKPHILRAPYPLQPPRRAADHIAS